MGIYQLNTYNNVNLQCRIYLTVEFQYLRRLSIFQVNFTLLTKWRQQWLKIVLHLFWLIDWWLTCWLTYWLLRLLTYWPIDWLTDWLTVADRLLDFLARSSNNWLDWSADILIFMLRKGINFNAFTMWIKITAIAYWNDWFFISDQICPEDASRCQQPGFCKAYLQYCKCCIDCFLTQVLNEPAKLCSLFKVLDRRTVSWAFSGHTWPNLTQIQNCLKFNVSVLMRDTCLNIIDEWEKNTSWVRLGFLLLLIFGKLFLVNYWQDRDS